MRTRDVHQTVWFNAPVGTVYDLLMNPRKHALLSGHRATMSAKAGSVFSVWGGGLHGFTLVAVRNKQIVQAWRSEEWPKYHYTVASYSFQKSGNRTRLVFDQYGVPAKSYRDIANGWKNYYWGPMKRLLEK
jgi:activator of Hsp90 ATPase protein 1